MVVVVIKGVACNYSSGIHVGSGRALLLGPRRVGAT